MDKQINPEEIDDDLKAEVMLIFIDAVQKALKKMPPEKQDAVSKMMDKKIRLLHKVLMEGETKDTICDYEQFIEERGFKLDAYAQVGGGYILNVNKWLDDEKEGLVKSLYYQIYGKNMTEAMFNVCKEIKRKEATQ